MAGCAGSDVLVQRQGSMEGRINQMMQAQNSTTTQMGELSLQVKELKEQVARQAAAGKDAAAEMEALRTKVDRLSRRLEQREAEASPTAAGRIEVVNREAEQESREEKIQSAYMRAFGLFSANNYTAAADAFSGVISSYPESEYAANARYWLGECHFATGRYREAIEAFARVLESRPSHSRGGEALLKTGLSWYALNDNEKGSASLRTLLEKYPQSEAAARAREELERR
jgi:tol-pal system protein YbgF